MPYWYAHPTLHSKQQLVVPENYYLKRLSKPCRMSEIAYVGVASPDGQLKFVAVIIG